MMRLSKYFSVQAMNNSSGNPLQSSNNISLHTYVCLPLHNNSKNLNDIVIAVGQHYHLCTVGIANIST